MAKNSSRKSKPPKAKPKTNEVRKDLTNVRVIQRKMAYVIGLPLSIADEDVRSSLSLFFLLVNSVFHSSVPHKQLFKTVFF